MNLLVLKCKETIFVPDAINSIGDYNSTRVGVACLSVICLFVVPTFISSFTMYRLEHQHVGKIRFF